MPAQAATPAAAAAAGGAGAGTGAAPRCSRHRLGRRMRPFRLLLPDPSDPPPPIYGKRSGRNAPPNFNRGQLIQLQLGRKIEDIKRDERIARGLVDVELKSEGGEEEGVDGKSEGGGKKSEGEEDLADLEEGASKGAATPEQGSKGGKSGGVRKAEEKESEGGVGVKSEGGGEGVKREGDGVGAEKGGGKGREAGEEVKKGGGGGGEGAAGGQKSEQDGERKGVENGDEGVEQQKEREHGGEKGEGGEDGAEGDGEDGGSAGKRGGGKGGRKSGVGTPLSKEEVRARQQEKRQMKARAAQEAALAQAGWDNLADEEMATGRRPSRAAAVAAQANVKSQLKPTSAAAAAALAASGGGASGGGNPRGRLTRRSGGGVDGAAFGAAGMDGFGATGLGGAGGVGGLGGGPEGERGAQGKGAHTHARGDMETGDASGSEAEDGWGDALADMEYEEKRRSTWVPIYTGWQYFRHPVGRAHGKGYLPRSTTQRLARKGGLVHIPMVVRYKDNGRHIVLPRVAWIAGVEAATSTGALGMQARVYDAYVRWASLRAPETEEEVPPAFAGLSLAARRPLPSNDSTPPGACEVFLVPDSLEEDEVAEALMAAGATPGVSVFDGDSDEEEEALMASGRACRWVPEWHVPVWMVASLNRRLAVEAALRVRRAASAAVERQPSTGLDGVSKEEEDEWERELLAGIGNDSEEEAARLAAASRPKRRVPTRTTRGAGGRPKGKPGCSGALVLLGDDGLPLQPPTYAAHAAVSDGDVQAADGQQQQQQKGKKKGAGPKGKQRGGPRWRSTATIAAKRAALEAGLHAEGEGDEAAEEEEDQKRRGQEEMRKKRAEDGTAAADRKQGEGEGRARRSTGTRKRLGDESDEEVGAMAAGGPSGGQKKKGGSAAKRARIAQLPPLPEDASWQQAAYAVVTMLMKEQCAEMFLEPVDEDEVPGYYDEIKEPMDLGTVSQRLASNQYFSPHAVKRDLGLIWSNCRTFNQEGSGIWADANACEALVSQLWAQAEVDSRPYGAGAYAGGAGAGAPAKSRTTPGSAGGKSKAATAGPSPQAVAVPSDWLQRVRHALRELMAQPYASSFLQPVDEDEVPGYYDIILEPMDLGTIMAKLTRTVIGGGDIYASYWQVLADVRKVWSNCLEFNEPASGIAADARTCSVAYDRLAAHHGLPTQTPRSSTPSQSKQRRPSSGANQQQQQTSGGGGSAGGGGRSRPRTGGPQPKGRYEHWSMRGSEVVRAVMHDKACKGWLFASPVKEKEAPGYHEIIKHPMDLGTIDDRLKKRRYATVQQFLSDVALVWHNCFLYNEVGDLVYESGRAAQQLFNRLWAPHQQALEQEALQGPARMQGARSSVDVDSDEPPQFTSSGRRRKPTATAMDADTPPAGAGGGGGGVSGMGMAHPQGPRTKAGAGAAAGAAAGAGAGAGGAANSVVQAAQAQQLWHVQQISAQAQAALSAGYPPQQVSAWQQQQMALLRARHQQLIASATAGGGGAAAAAAGAVGGAAGPTPGTGAAGAHASHMPMASAPYAAAAAAASGGFPAAGGVSGGGFAPATSMPPTSAAAMHMTSMQPGMQVSNTMAQQVSQPMASMGMGAQPSPAVLQQQQHQQLLLLQQQRQQQLVAEQQAQQQQQQQQQQAAAASAAASAEGAGTGAQAPAAAGAPGTGAPAGAPADTSTQQQQQHALMVQQWQYQQRQQLWVQQLQAQAQQQLGRQLSPEELQVRLHHAQMLLLQQRQARQQQGQ